MTGCDQLSFNPSLYAQPTTTETDTASGIDVNLSVPQQLSPNVPSPSELRATTVTLPAGFSINPNAADGKTSCSDAEARFGTAEEAQCPEYSKVGSLTIESSALPGPIPGYVYLGEPLPGNRYRIFLVADGFATHIKLAGTVTPDPRPASSPSPSPNSPEPADRLQHALLRLRTRTPRDPDPVRHLPRRQAPSPPGIGLARADLDPVLHPRSRARQAAPCPGASRPFNPSFQAASLATHRRRPHPPSRSNSPAPTATRT